MKIAKLVCYITGVIIVGIVSHIVIGKFYQNTNSFIAAFKEASSRSIWGTVEMSGTIDEDYLSKNARKDLITKIAWDVGMEGQIEILRTGDADKNLDIYYIEKDLSGVSLRIDLIEESGEDSNRYQVIAKLRLEDNVDELMRYRDSMMVTLEKYCQVQMSALNMAGSYKGRLDETTKKQIIKDIMNRLNGKKVDHIVKENLDTIYGYSRMLQESIVNNSQTVNFNIAFSYNEQADETMLYLATPIITTSY